jgi:hypothetical protein
MANIPIPQQGQPIDYQYIYQIVDALNDLSTKVSSKFSESSFTNDTVKEKHRLNDMSVDVGMDTYSDTDSKNAISKTHSFAINFKYPPIVTATIVDPTGNQACWVTIDHITTSSMHYYIWFRDPGSKAVTGKVHIQAIGIPTT